jgi:hypothetical protein
LKTEFVLVDFENVQPTDPALLAGGLYKIKIFLGPHQGKIPVAMARALQAFGPDVEYIQINGSGRNAVDFHIAFYIGQLAGAAAESQFHVVSKDTGFDPLLEHLGERGIRCRRSISIATIPLNAATKSASESIADRAKVVIANLTKRKSARPRTLKTLRSTIKALFGSQLIDEDLDRLIEHLARRGVTRTTDGKVQYELPA